jgi:hypothetical protein
MKRQSYAPGNAIVVHRSVRSPFLLGAGLLLATAFMIVAAFFSTWPVGQSRARLAAAEFPQDRLAPPRHVALPVIPAATQPQPRDTSKMDSPSAARWSLPLAGIPSQPLILEPERQPVTWQRPVVDSPPLAVDNRPTMPAPITLIVTQRAFVASADPYHAAPLGPLPPPIERPRQTIEDPTAGSVGAAVVAAQPLPLANPAPLLRLTLPDPYARLRAVELAQPPDDADAPEASRLRPLPAPLPPATLPLDAAPAKP